MKRTNSSYGLSSPLAYRYISVDGFARVFWFTNIYIEMWCARGQHTFVVVTYAGCWHLHSFCYCRCGSCITTYFNIMFFLLLCCYFRLLDVHSFCLFQRRFSPFSRHFVFFSTNLFFLLLLFCFTLYNVGFSIFFLCCSCNSFFLLSFRHFFYLIFFFISLHFSLVFFLWKTVSKVTLLCVWLSRQMLFVTFHNFNFFSTSKTSMYIICIWVDYSIF